MELLIEELTPLEANVISESSPDSKQVYLNGIFMQSGVKNRNGREYPLSEITNAVNTASVRIKESKGLMGELDHPQSLTINLDRVSHIITEMQMVGPNAVGKAKILSTPMGNIAKELINSEVRIGVSSRGAGNVNESGGVSGFNFITVDLVATPSAELATPDSVYESLMEAKNGHNIMNLAEAVRHDPVAQDYFKKEISRWLSLNLFQKN